jgi:hypothetical protein
VTEEKDYRSITIDEAMEWVDKNCVSEDARKQLKSRAVAWRIGTLLLIAINYVADLEKRIAKLEAELAKKRKKK